MVMLPREQLLQGSRRPEALLPLIALADQALRTRTGVELVRGSRPA